MKKFSLVLLTILVVFAAGGAILWVKKMNTKPAIMPTVVPTVAPSTTPVPMNDGLEIKKALYQKNKWPEGSVGVSISNNDGTYAKGMVNGQGGGGLFFAAKKGGIWNIVADGNGIIPCESLKDYPDFPNTLIPECFDQATNKLIKR